ncbi:MAG: transporter substrate-binding domain-containing protein [Bacteroidia bacterium]|nr:transporter substrate-binding domain-containing protein [Bacteroidia bacterium]NNF82176.1 transporter substrate-binding domain-containing protein [Flavobacteriaceae bacterium]NNK69386.1 transporter substrate-binding domain-containing protein [Flavobacteriaceae bacterium]NNL80312.1 transporter substrate-binding domain-containing protein [Flavobacteriaceae bacterium]
MRLIWKICGILFLMVFTGHAQEREKQDTLVIGYSDAPPFLLKSNGNIGGINAWLWTRLAEDLELEYRFEEMTFSELIPALESDIIDVCINPLTITADRKKTIDFTMPYFASHSTIAVPESSSLKRFGTFVRGFFNINFLKGMGGLLLLISVFGLFGWYFERRKNPDHFRGGIKGVWDGLWWSAVTLTTVGYGDKAPKSSPGKLVALLLMFIGLLFISGLTARVASSMTVNELNSSSMNFNSFKDKRVGTVGSTSTVAFLNSHFFKDLKTYDNAFEGLHDLQADKLDAFFYDEPILRYRMAQDSSLTGLTILPLKFDVQFYAFGLSDSQKELEVKLSQGILEIIESKEWEIVLNEYGLSEF